MLVRIRFVCLFLTCMFLYEYLSCVYYMVSYPMSVRVHFITAFFIFLVLITVVVFSADHDILDNIFVWNAIAALCERILYMMIFFLYMMIVYTFSLYDDTSSLYDDTSSLYDDTFPLYDDTFPLYDDTSSLYGDTSSSHSRMFSNKTRSAQVIV